MAKIDINTMRKKQGIPAAQTEQQKQEPPKLLMKKPPPTPKPDKVTYACKHEESIKQLESHPCPACQKTARTARMARKRQREATTNEEGNEPGGWRGTANKHLSRLPHGSIFTVRYDGEAKEWGGELSIKQLDDSQQRFHGKAGGVFHLLADLDGLFRAWAAQGADDGGAASS